METAVLYRDNESALPLIDRLDRKGIPFRIRSVDMAFFTHRVVTDVTDMMRFALNPKDTELFMRIYFKCQTFLRKVQAEELCRVSRQRDIPVLEAVEYLGGINGRILGNCRGLATNLKSMLGESPSKAIFRIENPCGYREYLERNNMDTGKLFILKQLSYEESSITSFLARLDELREMLKNRRPYYDCPFILSTIHSSKGLEYDRVYLMDICDGVFPDQLDGAKCSATDQEKKQFEEERRLFYVGMTRAKNDLSVFRLMDKESRFIRELSAPEGNSTRQPARVKGNKGTTGAAVLKKRYGTVVFGSASAKGTLVSSYELIIGDTVVSDKYGHGVITDVEYEKQTDHGKNGIFSVQFDSGGERTFLFPNAFQSGMRLENGDVVEIGESRNLSP